MANSETSSPPLTRPVVNVAAYRFVTLDQLAARRERFLARCDSLGLKGTILLSPEGINLFLAGGAEAIDTFLAELRSDPPFANLAVKVSPSDSIPFDELFVKIKREIIAFGVEGIDPRERVGQKLSPRDLKRWLDEGRPLTLLDTRNEYEIDFGTFAGAVHLDLKHFRDFPGAIRRLPEEVKQQPIVMFCTGGIRCEKAGLLLEREGFPTVLQLDGGILNYFEECGGDHWQGECFVFDQRVALDPELRETSAKRGFEIRKHEDAD